MPDPTRIELPAVPHGRFKGGSCCGCLIIKEVGQDADLVCNECGDVVITVPSSRALEALLLMEKSSGLRNEVCSGCGELNIFLGFSSMEACICRLCGYEMFILRTVH